MAKTVARARKKDAGDGILKRLVFGLLIDVIGDGLKNLGAWCSLDESGQCIKIL